MWNITQLIGYRQLPILTGSDFKFFYDGDRDLAKAWLGLALVEPSRI